VADLAEAARVVGVEPEPGREVEGPVEPWLSRYLYRSLESLADA
jgi:hypothetical protein